MWVMAEGGASFPIDIAVGPGEIVVYAELAGTQIGDVRLSTRGTQLTIRARPSPRPALETGARWIARERRVGSARRTIELPYAVDLNRVSIAQSNGVLEIRLVPKASLVDREGLRVLERPASSSGTTSTRRRTASRRQPARSPRAVRRRRRREASPRPVEVEVEVVEIGEAAEALPGIYERLVEEAELESAEAELESAEAELESTEAELESAEAELVEALSAGNPLEDIPPTEAEPFITREPTEAEPPYISRETVDEALASADAELSSLLQDENA